MSNANNLMLNTTKTRFRTGLMGLLLLVTTMMLCVFACASAAWADDETLLEFTAEDGNTYSYSKDGTSATIRGIAALANTDCVLPSTINGLRVTAIAENAFEGQDRVTTLVIPDSVVTVGQIAFAGMTSLVSAHWPETYVGIFPDSVFWGCTSLTDINIPDGITQLGGWCFYNCSALETVTIPESLTSIGKYCFMCDNENESSSLKSVKFSGTPAVTSMGNYAFKNCGELTDIEVPSTLKMLGVEVFRNCKSVERLVMPSGVVSIPDKTFKGCSSLRELVFAGNVRELQKQAIAYCPSLERVVFLGDVTSITLLGDPFSNTFKTTIYTYPEYSGALSEYVKEVNEEESGEEGTYELAIGDVNDILSELTDISTGTQKVSTPVTPTNATTAKTTSGSLNVPIIVIACLLAFCVGAGAVFFAMRRKGR